MRHAVHFVELPSPRDIAGRVGLVIVSILWIGLLLGVSFLATPVKFQAPSLTLPVALDVGRQTFAVFNGVELGLSAVLMVCTIIIRHPWTLIALAVGQWVLVATQTLWLLPALDARVAIILAGGSPSASSLHMVYIGVDAAKLLLLAVLTIAGLRRLLSS